MRLFFLLILSLLLTSTIRAQDDSLQALSYDAYMEQVMTHHPYAFQANIIRSMGASTLLQSRGAFDPKLQGDIGQKYFEGKQYYSHIDGSLKIPTWFGISAEAGYTLNDGVFLNPENRVPSAGLWFAGLRLDLGNGLIMNQRRAEFEKAKLFQANSELERTVFLNQLRRDASIVYWKWQQSYQKMIVYRQAYENAALRYEGIRESAIFGDRPYIDTVEASLIVQSRNLSMIRAKTAYENATLKLEIYLWSDGFIPLELNNSIPDESSEPRNLILPIELDSLIANHPYAQMWQLEQQQKEIDLQLKREQWKPQLTLKYNAINEPINNNPLASYSPSNYTWGATFAYPLLSRKARGGVQLAKLKLQDQQLKIKTYGAELKYTINAALNNYQLANEQLIIGRELVDNNQVMYDSEISLFEMGESSIFMINTRESNWLKAKIQFIEISGNYRMLFSELYFQLML